MSHRNTANKEEEEKEWGKWIGGKEEGREYMNKLLDIHNHTYVKCM